MKAYKVFDKNWKCKDMQYEVGKIYQLLDLEGNLIEPIMCVRGFHACLKVNDCFNYYNFDSNNKIAEVELLGTILGIEEDKQCTNIIEIIKEVSWIEMLSLTNTGKGCSGHSNSGNRNSGNRNSGYYNSGYYNSGDYNSGDYNSGDYNSGNYNSGYRNSGDYNSGYYNSGDFNSGDYNSGYFNSNTPNEVRVFNKLTSRQIWEDAIKPDFIYFSLHEWISFPDMDDQEKIDQPQAFVCNGYLKKFGYKEAWAKSFAYATSEDIKLLKALPNFDADIFEEISGIKIV